MATGLMKLPENGVRRNYTGGAGIDRLHGRARWADNNMPEEWVGSMVEASNPGMEPIAHEGLTVAETAGGPGFLRDIIGDDWEFYLGIAARGEGGWRLSFLLKILDSVMRLHVQAHPTTRFANEVMGMPCGKLKCYYIPNVRKGISPYIRLGLQYTPGRDDWREIVEKQDKARMDDCFEEIPVQVGEVWHIPGGIPHAIGEGITMLEIMEPSDLVVRCEFEREGIVVPEDGRLMGRGLDFCLDIFDYTEYPKEEIMKKCKIEPRVLEETDAFRRVCLVDETLTSCFLAEKLEVTTSALVRRNQKFSLGVVCAGSCAMKQNRRMLSLKAGDSSLIAAGAETYQVRSESSAQLVMVYPGEDMDTFQSKFRLRTESWIIKEAFNMGSSARTPDSR